MSKDKPKIAFLAFHSYAGMGPYVATIINSFSPEDNFTFFLIEDSGKYYSRNINKDIIKKGIIAGGKTSSKLKTFYQIAFDGRSDYHKEILNYCKKENIDVIHDLTGSSDCSLIKKLNKDFKVFYTVHDLHPHEINKSFFKNWKLKTLYKRVYKSVEEAENLITNSKSQLKEQLRLFPHKSNFYSPFPTLITDEIREGNKIPNELKGIKDYILFFGRIEEYKGLRTLIEAFNLGESFNKNHKLVIAGSGELDVSISNTDIIFINRYIGDEEVANLYRNAACVVYPYISATQSGVLSIASFFKTPTILSDVAFFKEVMGVNYPWLFDRGNAQDLAKNLDDFFKLDSEQILKIKDFLSEIYTSTYSDIAQRESLMNIYSKIK